MLCSTHFLFIILLTKLEPWSIIVTKLAVANIFALQRLARANLIPDSIWFNYYKSEDCEMRIAFAKKQPVVMAPCGKSPMNLTKAEEGKEYIVERIDTDDAELNAFLFSLGCYSGEPITVVSRRRGGCTVSIKDGRYNIDDQLAEAIGI